MSYLHSKPVFCRPKYGTSAIGAALLVLAVGCDSKSPPTPKPTIDISPQAKFDRLVAVLRSELETGSDSGSGRYTFSDSSASGSTIFSYTIEAPEKISEPSRPGAPPHATVKITQTSTFSSVVSPSEDNQDNEQADKRNSLSEVPPEQRQAVLEDMGFEVLDPELVGEDFSKAMSGPRLQSPKLASEKVTAEKIVEYKLIFENDRWRMASPPPAEAPESANYALDLALKRQQ